MMQQLQIAAVAGELLYSPALLPVRLRPWLAKWRIPGSRWQWRPYADAGGRGCLLQGGAMGAMDACI